VKYSKIASEQILAIMVFIAQKSYPETSIKFCDLLFDFGNTLETFPEKHPICHREPFRKRNLHCALFKKFIFIYSIGHETITILSVIHSSRLQ
jgi:plasmid stabilization system protein ParE